MRIVVDTNVLVSAMLSPGGPPARILDGLIDRKLITLHDPRIMEEYRDVFTRSPLHLPADLVEAVLYIVEFAGEEIDTLPWPVKLPDPDDAMFLEVALHGSADALITGNLRHFLPASPQPFRILSPADFVRFWAKMP